MKRFLGGFVALAALLVLAPATQAHAAQIPGPFGSANTYMGWRTAPHTVCFSYPDNGGLKRIVSATVNVWTKSDATVVRRNDCAASGFAANQTIRMAFRASSGGECATTDTGSPLVWKGPLSRIGQDTLWAYGPPGVTTIWINSNVVSGCRSTAAQWEHLISHEVGHGLGLGHGAGGIMSSQGYGDGNGWDYRQPTATNLNQVSFLY